MSYAAEAAWQLTDAPSHRSINQSIRSVIISGITGSNKPATKPGKAGMQRDRRDI